MEKELEKKSWGHRSKNVRDDEGFRRKDLCILIPQCGGGSRKQNG